MESFNLNRLSSTNHLPRSPFSPEDSNRLAIATLWVPECLYFLLFNHKKINFMGWSGCRMSYGKRAFSEGGDR